jgi:hypothetical protein
MTTNVSDIVRAFEPILYFADGERFFPSDCKRYLERCALWNAVDPFDQSASWRRDSPGAAPGPILEHRQVSGRLDETGTFLGEVQGGALPFLFASGKSDGFLEVTGWSDGASPSPARESRFAGLDQLEKLYNSTAPGEGDAFLSNSRFWYHAEVFDAVRLRLLMTGSNAPPLFREIIPDPFAGRGRTAVALLLFLFPGARRRARQL